MFLFSDFNLFNAQRWKQILEAQRSLHEASLRVEACLRAALHVLKY